MGLFSNQPLIPLGKLKKAWCCFKEGGIPALRARLVSSRPIARYGEWVRQFDEVDDADRELVKSAAQELPIKPKISVITPVFNPPLEHFRRCLDSVLRQAYENWELCLADDCSTDPEVRKVLEEYRGKDPRVKVIYREGSGHISAASNSAISIATGDYLAFLDHDDELTLDAFYLVALELNNHPDAQLIYSDEDKKTAVGARIDPHFKSDWNPELLLHQNYICHLLVIRKDTVDKVGGLRTGLDGAQDWDLILRVSEVIKKSQIRHIPHVLYHWTITPSSTATSTSAKPYVLEAQVRAVQEHLDRLRQAARARIRYGPSSVAVERVVPEPQPMVSLIMVAGADPKRLMRCVDTLLGNTSYKNYELIVVLSARVEPSVFHHVERLSSRPRVKVVRDERAATIPALSNVGVANSSGGIVGFVSDDLQFTNPQWLKKMVAQAIRPEVGVVGARLIASNNRVSHGGIILGIGDSIGHSHRGRARDDYGYFHRAVLSHYVSAVTASCLLVRREVFDKVGGFNEEFAGALYDVDLCLRARGAGLEIVYEPEVEIYQQEPVIAADAGAVEQIIEKSPEFELLKKRWCHVLKNDPYYNPNLTGHGEDFALAFPPRVHRRWRTKERVGAAG